MAGTWDRVTTWRLVIPPSRPDVSDLRRIRCRLQAIDRTLPVGVLGSTAEFRDLLFEMGFSKVCVLDNNLSYFERASGERVFSSEETLIQGDWLDTLPQHPAYFAVLLSDLTSGNIRYDQRRAFYSGIAASLAPGGLFIDKQLTNEGGLLTIDQIRARYRDATPDIKTANYFNCEAIFCCELLREYGILETDRIYDTLATRLPGHRFAALLQVTQLVTPRGCLWYYGKKWSELVNDYCPTLTFEHRFDLAADQPYFGRGYQYFWRKEEVS